MPESRIPHVEPQIPFGYLILIGLIAGLLIGLFMGVAEALSGMTPRDGRKAIVLGVLVGAGGGVVGLTFGQAVYSAFDGLAMSAGFLSFLLNLIGRGFGWGMIGLFIGVSQGLATNSTARMRSGAIGGFIGGAFGGSAFEVIKWMNGVPGVNIPPAIARLIAFSVTGGATGLFIGCVEELAKQAWLVRLVGNNEGRAIDLYGSRVVIGRSELADIPIFSDPDVSEKHAAVFTQGKAYYIEDLGSTFGTSVNGDNITKEYLRDGDRISVGKTKFVFHDKATARLVSSAGRQGAAVQIPTSQHVCPFCGSIKDAAGNCDCSVAAGQPAAAQPNLPAAPAASGLPGNARLVAVSGPYSGQTFPLKSGETLIGREASKDIGLPMDSTVSRNHARIAQELAGYVLYDTGSTNGTFAGGQKIQRYELHPGDLVQIGCTKFTFEQ